MLIRPYEPPDQPAVLSLWQSCALIRPQNNPHKDIARKLAVQPHLFLVGIDESINHVVATVMAGYEGHRGWLNYVAVSPAHRRQGLGRQILLEAEHRLRALGCPKINLQVFPANAAAIAFYQSLGYLPDQVLSLGKRLEVD